MRRPVPAAALPGLCLSVTATAAAAPQEASTEALMQADRDFFAAASERGWKVIFDTGAPE